MGFINRWLGKSLVYWILPIIWTIFLMPIIAPEVLSFGEKTQIGTIVSFTINNVTHEITMGTILLLALTQYVPALILFALTEWGFRYYIARIIWKPIVYCILSIGWAIILLPIIGPVLLSVSESMPFGTLFSFNVKGVTYYVTITTLVAVAFSQIIPALILFALIEQGRNKLYKWRVSWKTFVYWFLTSCWVIILLPVFGPRVMSAGQQIPIQMLFNIVIEGTEYTVTVENTLAVLLTQIVPILILFGLTEIGHPEKPKEEEKEEPAEVEEPKVACKECGIEFPASDNFCPQCGTPREGVKEPQEVEEKEEPAESKTETLETSNDNKSKKEEPWVV